MSKSNKSSSNKNKSSSSDVELYVDQIMEDVDRLTETVATLSVLSELEDLKKQVASGQLGGSSADDLDKPANQEVQSQIDGIQASIAQMQVFLHLDPGTDPVPTGAFYFGNSVWAKAYEITKIKDPSKKVSNFFPSDNARIISVLGDISNNSVSPGVKNDNSYPIDRLVQIKKEGTSLVLNWPDEYMSWALRCIIFFTIEDGKARSLKKSREAESRDIKSIITTGGKILNLFSGIVTTFIPQVFDIIG